MWTVNLAYNLVDKRAHDNVFVLPGVCVQNEGARSAECGPGVRQADSGGEGARGKITQTRG